MKRKLFGHFSPLFSFSFDDEVGMALRDLFHGDDKRLVLRRKKDLERSDG